MSNTAKCKRGDYVAFQETHSATTVKYERSTWTTFHLGQVDTATREGIAKKLTRSYPEFSSIVRIEPGCRVQVMCLPHEMQRAAGELFRSHPCNGFKTAEDLKSALRMEHARVSVPA